MKESLKNKPAILYMARNKITDDFYIGITSKFLNKRKIEHYSASRRGNGNKFYNAIRKYGEDSFIWTKIGGFEIYKDCLEAEKYLISTMFPKYNTTLGGQGVVGYLHSNETKDKMSMIKLGKPSLQKGRKRTAEQKQNIKLGIKKYFETNVRRSGWKPSQETKNKMSQSKRGKSPRPSIEIIENLKINGSKSAAKRRKPVFCINDDKKFISVREAANFYNLCTTTIGAICNGKRKAAYGLKFEWSK